MRESEYKKILSVFQNDNKFIPEPKKTYESIQAEASYDDSRAFILLKDLKQPVIVCIDEQYSSILKSIPKMYKEFYTNFINVVSQQKKIAILCSRELRRSLSKTSKTNPLLKSKRINKELNTSIKKNNREETTKQKREEREEEIKKKKEDEEREALRQKRKFNYLMSQTEAFASFFLNKRRKEEDPVENVAVENHLKHLKEFDEPSESIKKQDTPYEYQFVNQPKILKARLKEHQLKGLNWLVNLYNQGINGILADDMGLGKTIQSIALLCHLYEMERVSGPFLIITPSSTLHNWTNELERFVPSFKVLNYWGGIQERKDMRKQLRRTNVVVTSYQIAVSDESILSKIKWQYMILDEAQAIKSINSQRWKILLGFKARNRLLLTGTPIQNSMQELWSLLHFIMPTLFDSLSEFSEWFSKDIEGKRIEEDQISKLHTILKPFMLRRNKNDIKDEIGSKEIIDIFCEMSSRQRILYDEIMESRMDYENILMQLKKVCNHPDLFEKLEPNCAFCLGVVGENGYVGFRSDVKRYIPDVINKKKDEIPLNVNRNCGVVRLMGGKDALMKNNDCISLNINNDALLMRGRDALMENNDYIPEYIAFDIVRRRSFIENIFKRFKLTHEKVFDQFITTNIDPFPPSIEESRIDRLTYVPPLNTFISDSGKLSQIDTLLKQLKTENHRVLIYFQMTKMMDLFEEYLVKREYNYIRLDGSSKISQRKELVDQWQNNEDVFIFILSTRAGGVGINLTAADTVIFYDSDWNPTVDQQAMDRVHRLGQTKDVTVYRLITKNSVEEKVMERASRKEEVQKIVIKGNVFEGAYLEE